MGAAPSVQLVPMPSDTPAKSRAYGWFGRSSASVGLRVAAGLVALLSILPLGYLVVRAFEVGPEAISILFRPRSLQVLTNTILLTLAVTATSTVIGVGLAWLTSRTDLPGRNLWAAILCLPLVLPSYVGAFALIAALGPNGMLQRLLSPLGVERLPSIYGFFGAWLALSLFAYPYVLLSVRAGLRGLDPSLEDAARSLGRTGREVFREIILPHLRPSIGAGALLVALYTLSDFGAVSLLQFNAFTREIYVQYSAALDRSAAAVLSLMLVGLTAVILWIEARTRGRARYYRSSAGSIRRQKVSRLGPWKLPALVFCSVVSFLALGIPLLVTGYWLASGWGAGEQLGSQWGLIFNSVTASGLASAGAVLAALPVVIYAVRHPGSSSRVIERAAYIGHALPGIVVALSLVFFGARYAPFFYQTLFMLVLAYTVLFLPLALGTLRASMLQISPRTEEVARTLGRTSRDVFATITLPQLRPGLWMGMALVFLSCMKELPASLILGPTGFQTLATRIWGATEEAFFARAAAPALILVVVSAISLALLLRHEDDALAS
ncbi:MAG TPA: iron ABC transporter permease [Kiritimatiellia bacterium]|nr:iron ABC transporter permease [Kiritimatiellia bacterium]